MKTPLVDRLWVQNKLVFGRPREDIGEDVLGSAAVNRGEGEVVKQRRRSQHLEQAKQARSLGGTAVDYRNI
jgi:hypothetical protein